jgi:PBSX family phage terminase large subunit
VTELFKCHSPKQEQLIFSDSAETYAITGIQWAKTTSGAWWMKRHMLSHTDKSDNFIIAAPTYKILQQSTLPAFLRIMDGFGEYFAGSAEFRMKGGGICFMRTGTEPDSVVGITNVRAVWGDEAGKFSLYFYENLISRASFRQAPALFTSTPYTMNWLYKQVLKPYREGKLKDTLIINARSCDNPYFPMAEYEKRRLSMDPRRFNAIYNGEFEKMQGLVYNCFEEDLHLVKPHTLPVGTKYYAGVDWGTTHPFVISVRAITPGGDHFKVSEYYKTGHTLLDMIAIAERFKQTWDIQTFYCDPSQPGYIEEFNRHGLSAAPAVNDIRKGIDLQYGLMKSGKYKVFYDGTGLNKHFVDELEMYHYPEADDLGPDDADKEQVPVKQDDHAMDAERYVTIMTYHSGIKKLPHVPGLQKREETHEDRVKRLKRKIGSRKTEAWS